MSNRPSYEFEMVTTSTGTVQAGLDGSTYWYDSGNPQNGELVLLDTGGDFAYWHNNITYVISGIADVGASPVNYYELQYWSDTIEVTDINSGFTLGGTYDYDGINDGKPAYINSNDDEVVWNSTDAQWYCQNGGSIYYSNPSADQNPPKTGWVPYAPIPSGFSLDYVDYTGSELTGNGSYTGTLSKNTNTISDAWYRAETTIFNSFADFVGAIEGRECFRGFEPVQGDSDLNKDANVWQMTSGASGEFEMSRLWGDNPNWCSLRSDVRIESTWTTRELAMKFSGAVIAWLKSTDNMNRVGNVTWCTLSEIPLEPEIYRTDGQMNRERLFKQTIDLEVVYQTESTY